MLVPDFVPRGFEWQRTWYLEQRRTWYLKWRRRDLEWRRTVRCQSRSLCRHSRSLVALPFETPGDKIWDQHFKFRWFWGPSEQNEQYHITTPQYYPKYEIWETEKLWYYPFKCSFQSVFFEMYPTCVSSYLCKFILLTSTTIQPPLDMAKDHTFPSPNILFVIKPTSAIGLLNKVLGIEDKKIGSTLTECRLSFSPISHKSLNRVNSGSSSTDVGETQD